MRALLLAAILSLPVLAEADLPWTPAIEKSWLGQVVAPEALVGAGTGTLLQQLTNSPGEWGRGPEGFGKRAASAFGTQFLNMNVRYGVARLRHEDLRYFPSQSKDLTHRLQHALVSTVVARNAETGDSMMALGRISGALAGGFGSRIWMPEQYRTFSGGASSTVISLGVDAGVNVIREFLAHNSYSRRQGRTNAMLRWLQ